ncbi:MAG: DNA polymerase IV [Bacilli bacterium]|nr:DNA polymerase IV [Bacilli bacterium]
MDRIIFHIDVNNAFLSWSAIEMLKNGSKLDIRTVPAVVGGDESKRRGVVVAKSFLAKKAGVVTGEPIYMARRKVKNLLVVQTNKEAYAKYSDAFYNILCKYSPLIERYSIDECFLDMSGTKKIFGDPVELAKRIKDEIHDTLGFTVNVGIGNSKLCAKMASDFEKPNKVHTLFDNEIKDKMWRLNVDDLFMVGKRSSARLHEMGINTIEDLAKTDVNLLVKRFKSYGITIHEYANGIDYSPVEKAIPKNQGISHSTTLPRDARTLTYLMEVLHQLSEMVGRRLRREEKYAMTVSVQLKNSDFFTYQHQKKLVNPISSNQDIYDVATELLKTMWRGDPIRLVGLRVTDFTDKKYEQISLFEQPSKKQKRDKVQQTLDAINEKYGSNTIKSASLFDINE